MPSDVLSLTEFHMVDLVDFESSHKDDGEDKDDINLSEDDDEEFVYPAAAPVTDVDTKHISSPRLVHLSPAQMESLYDAAFSGDLPRLKGLFKDAQSAGMEPFKLANDASSSPTGFTLLHVAASRGYYDMSVWLIEDCVAMPYLEDREGETALYKAALNGHTSIVSYLVPGKVDVHASDADGWTALHNASSKGYLDIVKWLCEKGGAASATDTGRGIDIRSNVGWTPLMNASSKGHLPVVLYLLTEQNADPLIRNKWGETAYDVAAAVFEVWICEILQNAEAERWRGVTTLYNPLLVHTTIPLILYENQRLDSRLKATVSGGRPKFSAAGLDRRSPFELKLPTVNDENGARFFPSSRSGVQLPLREASWILPRPATIDHPAPDGVERSHFWLSDWTLDFTHPAVDAEEGWQYAQYFDDPDEKWNSEMPIQLKKITSSNGNSSGPGGPSSRGPLFSSANPGRSQLQWVRRRRWVRIMRRRLDIPPSPFLQPDGAMYHLDLDGDLIPYVEKSYNNEKSYNDSPDPDGQELGTMSSTFLASAQDYVSRARYLVGNHLHDWDANEGSSIEIRRAIAKLERATTELRQGILRDDETERKTQAEVLLNTYSRDLERRRLSAGARGLLLTDTDDSQEADDVSSDEFHYPTSETPRPTSRSSGSTDYLSRTGTSRVPVDLTPHLTQAPDFRVPTREAPQNVLSPRRTPPPGPKQLLPLWERDETVQQCRNCRRGFNLLNRRHCRKCGKIFCDDCSSHRIILGPADVVHDPTMFEVTTHSALRRVCQSCYKETSGVVSNRLNRSSVMEGIVADQMVDQEHFIIPGSMADQFPTH